ncbi:phosphoenolpyruvate carboxykinase [Heterostelium album PN500]|uniref:Phosphoenolpyruvate carboxykinase (ATP) n=1 Tax=Heterostelium pallidum (strain ATCC 26659 / Pp 5 / PN500) TaxID=670386 RepID=D3BIJ3_HETP5|nr:phosphoenolpyruvate carboxykinase [Heterostelium album PN500]EFA78617.1 phosphoenolpyruvate carboxykinase [Heterostelium album PN500]|eukprot:XP_020430741.1 phosphoenolpyruvate carboxykinase [Heterostelium album PN500]
MSAINQQVAQSISKSLSASTADVPPESHDHADTLDVDSLHLDEHFTKQTNIFHNPPVPVLYEQALAHETGSAMTSTGALVTRSGAKTGRSPKDKRIVQEPSSSNDIWWGPVNMPLDDLSFMINRERAIDYLNTVDKLFVIDGYAGWDPAYRIKVRVICARAYHALFMNNMLIRPTKEELKTFGEPDYTIYNAGQFPANRFTKGMSSATSVSLDFARREMVILGTQYAGEMKKGVLTIMMYLMPKMGVLPLHSSCNEGKEGDVTLFFGLSGTGKTTLSADPNRYLIGDDEHVWTDHGVFNIEGGCYAKCIDLSREKEPEIFDAIRFGAVLENVVYNEYTRKVDYNNISITENTRCAYPLEFIPNTKFPALSKNHPKNIIMLTCDAFGILPPVSKLTPQQVMYHFIQGYTAKVAGTEVGVTEPTAAFSSCYGEPFIVWHPTKYAHMLAEQLQKFKSHAWLINTGWTGGSYGIGSRVKLAYTRAIIDAIHSGELEKVPTTPMEVFGLHVPTSCPGVPSEILMPSNTWSDKAKYTQTLTKLATLFIENFKKYQDKAPAEVLAAGPKL